MNDAFEQKLKEYFQTSSTKILEETCNEMRERLENIRSTLFEHPPPSYSNANLLVKNGKETAWFPLKKLSCSIGTAQSNDLVLADQFSSKYHCSLEEKDGGWELKDLNSKNGVYVNGERVGCQYLKDGDVILVGNTSLVFVKKMIDDLEPK